MSTSTSPAAAAASPATAAAQPSLQTPRLVDIELIADGWIKKYVLTYELPDGTLYRYDCASRKAPEAFRAGLEANAQNLPASPDAVCIVGFTENDELLMIREFRYPLTSWCIAFPAGLVESGEDLASCVDRELREETGYALRVDAGEELANAIKPLPQAGFSSTGLTDETVQIVYAQVTRVADATPEQGELIEQFLLPRADVARFVAENTTPIGTRAQLVLEALCDR